MSTDYRDRQGRAQGKGSKLKTTNRLSPELARPRRMAALYSVAPALSPVQRQARTAYTPCPRQPPASTVPRRSSQQSAHSPVAVVHLSVPTALRKFVRHLVCAQPPVEGRPVAFNDAVDVRERVSVGVGYGT